MRTGSMSYIEFNTWQAKNLYNFTVLQRVAFWHLVTREWRCDCCSKGGRISLTHLTHPEQAALMAVEDRLYPSAENSSKHNLIQSILLPPTLQATVHWPLKSCFMIPWNQCFTLVFIMLLISWYMVKFLSENDATCRILCHNLSCSCVNFPYFYGPKCLTNDSWDYFH